MADSAVRQLTRWIGARATRRAAVTMAALAGAGANHPAVARKRKKKKRCPSCPASDTLWAVVNADGSLDRVKGASTSRRVSDGAYEVTFERDVALCAAAATLRSSGFVFTNFPLLDTPPAVVTVTTLDRAGFVHDIGFHLIITC